MAEQICHYCQINPSSPEEFCEKHKLRVEPLEIRKKPPCSKTHDKIGEHTPKPKKTRGR